MTPLPLHQTHQTALELRLCINPTGVRVGAVGERLRRPETGGGQRRASAVPGGAGEGIEVTSI